VRGLGLKSGAKWLAYCKSGKKPDDIPSFPNQTYENDGWAGINDWLGTGKRRRSLGWRPYRGARAYVRGLRLKSQHDWSDYCKSGKKPADIPTHPERAYSEAARKTRRISIMGKVRRVTRHCGRASHLRRLRGEKLLFRKILQ